MNVNIRAMYVDRTADFNSPVIGLTLAGATETTWTLTKAQVVAFYQTTTGNAAARREQTIAWVKNQMAAALGTDPLLVDLDLLSDGSVTLFRLRHD